VTAPLAAALPASRLGRGVFHEGATHVGFHIVGGVYVLVRTNRGSGAKYVNLLCVHGMLNPFGRSHYTFLPSFADVVLRQRARRTTASLHDVVQRFLARPDVDAAVRMAASGTSG